MGNCFGEQCEKALFEIRDILKEINQKMCHLIEQHRAERQMFLRNRGEE